MAVHAHGQHRDASDERVRLANLAKHEQEVRERERARERRRMQALLPGPGRPCDDFPGCVE
jgi:hypothetical protein